MVAFSVDMCECDAKLGRIYKRVSFSLNRLNNV